MNRLDMHSTAIERRGFGELLREWRAARGVSQLALSVETGVSARHLSFMETGRASPSRDMVLTLAEALEMPLRDRNSFLQAAEGARDEPRAARSPATWDSASCRRSARSS